MNAYLKTLFLKPRPLVFAAAGLLLIISAIIVYLVRINESIGLQRQRQEAGARVEVDQRELRAPVTDGMTVSLNSAEVRAVAAFKGAVYLATSGGLIALDDGGNVRKRYSSLDGLPDNDLTCLAVFGERLFAGTASAGLLAFDGNAFTGYRFEKPKATRVCVLVPTETELLIGTLDGGLFEYDGQRFTRRFNSNAGADFNRVTALLALESRLYVGTQDAGLYLWREGHVEHFGTNEGLPSPHVTAFARTPTNLEPNGSVCVATDFGVVALNDAGELKPISYQPNVISLLVSGDRLWAGLFTGGIIDLSAGAARLASSTAREQSLAVAPGLPSGTPTKLALTEGKVWALTSSGAFVRDEQTARPGFEAIAGALVGDRTLTSGHITALAADGSRLWVGYFDRGIDLLSTETSERLSHLEDDRVREINYLLVDRSGPRLLAATSRGLVSFSGNMKPTVMTREQGLVNDSVAHVTIAPVDSIAAPAGGTPGFERSRGAAMVLATAGGLTEVVGGLARSITAFHGLASNHLYTSAAVGSRLFAGSVAGLVEMEGLRVTRTYKTSNSRLSHDWVTALAAAEGTLYIGTNGGGVDALLPTGEWVNYSDELGKFEVNQNAMHYDGERLYVGTSDRGLLVYNTRDRRWNRFSAGLPSQSVTAITSDGQFVYLGTLNGLVRIEKRSVESL